MKMPEGWIRVNKSILEYKTTTDTERMLDLMKEMAEALEDMVKACKAGYGRDINKMEEALTRFKEWR